MSVKEQVHERTVDFGISVITAKRVFLTTWADRYSISGTDPHRIPVFNESHIDASINASLEKCRVVRKTVVEHPEGGTDSSRYALVTVEYSTRPSGTVSITADTIAFVDSNPDTITDSGNGFLDAGFKPGVITVTGSVNNDANYTIDAAGVAAGVLTLIGGDTLIAEAAGALVTITQENTQIVRTLELSAQVLMQEVDSKRGFQTVVNSGITIAFVNSNPDTITDSGSGFGSFVAVKIVVSGSTNNDGVYTVASVVAGTLTLDAAESLTAEVAGASVTISQGALLEKPISLFFPQGVLTVTKTLDAFPFSTIKGLITKLNDDTFYGEPAETFLFLGTSTREIVNETGDNLWVIDYKFQYNPIGWNKFWNKETSSFEKINPEPYTKGNFDTLDVEPAA